jgi:hypothetical protein
MVNSYKCFFTGFCEYLLPQPSSLISKKSPFIRRGFSCQSIQEAAYFFASGAASTPAAGFEAVALSRAKETPPETQLIINAASNPNVSFLFIFIYCRLNENQDSFRFLLILRTAGEVSFRKSCRFAAIFCRMAVPAI